MIPRAEIPVERIRELSGDRRFLAAVQDFYEGMQRRIDQHRPVCRNRGVCCRFER